MPLRLVKNADLITTIEDGFNEAKENDCEGFSYTIGKIRGGSLKLTFEPDDIGTMEIIQIDGVDGFGFCLVDEA